MLVGGVIGHEVHDHLEPQAPRLGDEPVEILQRAEQRVDACVVGDVVAVILHRRGVDRARPDRVAAEPGDVLEPLLDALQVAHAVAVRVLERRRWKRRGRVMAVLPPRRRADHGVPSSRLQQGQTVAGRGRRSEGRTPLSFARRMCYLGVRSEGEGFFPLPPSFSSASQAKAEGEGTARLPHPAEADGHAQGAEISTTSHVPPVDRAGLSARGRGRGGKARRGTLHRPGVSPIDGGQPIRKTTDLQPHRLDPSPGSTQDRIAKSYQHAIFGPGVNGEGFSPPPLWHQPPRVRRKAREQLAFRTQRKLTDTLRRGNFHDIARPSGRSSGSPAPRGAGREARRGTLHRPGVSPIDGEQPRWIGNGSQAHRWKIRRLDYLQSGARRELILRSRPRHEMPSLRDGACATTSAPARRIARSTRPAPTERLRMIISSTKAGRTGRSSRTTCRRGSISEADAGGDQRERARPPPRPEGGRPRDTASGPARAGARNRRTIPASAGDPCSSTPGRAPRAAAPPPACIRTARARSRSARCPCGHTEPFVVGERIVARLPPREGAHPPSRRRTRCPSACAPRCRRASRCGRSRPRSA